MSEPNPRNARLTLLLIIAVFAVPMIAAYLYRPTGEPASHGTLIDPPRPLQDFRMTGLDGGGSRCSERPLDAAVCRR